jgi:hypothetical protein
MFGQDRCGNQFECSIFSSRDLYGSSERSPAGDAEIWHRRGINSALTIAHRGDLRYSTYMQHYGRHLIHVAIVLGTTALLSTVAVTYALGYKVNWTTKSFEQTGIIEVSGKLAPKDARISVNGKLVDEKLPLRLSWLLPGTYDISISKDGYESWQQSVAVHRNRVSMYSDLLLLLKEFQPVEVTSSDQSVLVETGRVSKGLEIRENELWADGNLIIRISDDIDSTQWFPDEWHIAYVANNQLWLIGLDGKNSRMLLNTTEKDLAFGFKEQGKTLVYREGGALKGLRLY